VPIVGSSGDEVKVNTPRLAARRLVVAVAASTNAGAEITGERIDIAVADERI
jgi:hypothetical protein